MAAPITHIVISSKLKSTSLSKYSSCWDRFIVGTSFPDIRYICKVDRSKTHLSAPNFSHVLNDQNCFTAGMRFHSYVDSIREEYVVESGLYEYIKDSPLKYSSLKFYEDILLSPKLKGVDLISNYFDIKNYPKKDLGVDSASINNWNKIVKEYITSTNLIDSIERFVRQLVPAKQYSSYINQIHSDIKVMEKHKLYKRAIENMYDNSEQIFS